MVVFREALKRCGHAISNAVLPNRCVLCHSQIDSPAYLCHECWPKINFIPKSVCNCCGMPFTVLNSQIQNADDSTLMCAKCFAQKPNYSKARAAVFYDDAVKQLILKYKHGDATHLAGVFSHWMTDSRFANDYVDVDYVIPVPLHSFRLIKRKYNQSGLLAKILAKHFNKSYEPCLAHRDKNTQPQGEKGVKQRKENVRGAFTVRKKDFNKINKKVIMIIDDVIASGSTVNELSDCLLKAGASEVRVHAIARVE